MKVEKISTYVTPKTTGYAATAGFGLAILAGTAKNKTIKNAHVPLAWTGAILTILHIGLIEYYNYKFKCK